MEKYFGNFGKYRNQYQHRPRTGHGFRLHNCKRPQFILPLSRQESEQEFAICPTLPAEKPNSTSQTDGSELKLCVSGPNPGSLTPDQILDLRKQYMTHKLRKLMAVEIVKNRVKGDLKRIVKQIDAQVQSNSQDFIILGGGLKSLNHFKADTASGFTLEVDVRGYMPGNVTVDQDDNQMTIRAIKVNGLRERALSLLAPSTKALERVKISPPRNGFLLLRYSKDT